MKRIELNFGTFLESIKIQPKTNVYKKMDLKIIRLVERHVSACKIRVLTILVVLYGEIGVRLGTTGDHDGCGGRGGWRSSV